MRRPGNFDPRMARNGPSKIVEEGIEGIALHFPCRDWISPITCNARYERRLAGRYAEPSTIAIFPGRACRKSCRPFGDRFRHHPYFATGVPASADMFRSPRAVIEGVAI